MCIFFLVDNCCFKMVSDPQVNQYVEHHAAILIVVGERDTMVLHTLAKYVILATSVNRHFAHYTEGDMGLMDPLHERSELR